MLKILCFGDSITLGEHDSEQGGWADRLKKHYIRQSLTSPVYSSSVYNLGIAGETSDGLVGRFQTELQTRCIKKQNLIIILAYGANDIIIHKNKNTVPEFYFIRNLKHSIERAHGLRAQVLLLSILPISKAIDGNIDQDKNLRYETDIQKYNRIIEHLSHETKSHYVDLYSFYNKHKEKYLSNDGLHPNSIGHEIIYKRVRLELNKIQAG